MSKKLRDLVLSLGYRALYRYETTLFSVRILWRHKGYVIRILVWAERLRDDVEKSDAYIYALLQTTDKDAFRSMCEVAYAVNHFKRSIWTEHGRP
jgi:hypothetical protein